MLDLNGKTRAILSSALDAPAALDVLAAFD